MSRPLRIEFPGAVYHITTRGDRKEDIFLSEDDRLTFLKVFSKVSERFEWVCYAYCLMDNHYHLVLETPIPNLSKGMAQLNGIYTQKFNWKNNNVGHVFQGRYKSIIVEKNAYLLELLRYVVLNPVRAEIIKEPGNYRWSSFRATAGFTSRPEWLNVSFVLNLFSEDREEAKNKYISFVMQGLRWGESIWNDLKQQIYLGSDEFIEEVQGYVKSTIHDVKSEIPREQIEAPVFDLQYYKSSFSDPKEGMARAYLEGRYSMKEIGDVFNVHRSTVSRAVKFFEEKEVRDN